MPDPRRSTRFVISAELRNRTLAEANRTAWRFAQSEVVFFARQLRVTDAVWRSDWSTVIKARRTCERAIARGDALIEALIELGRQGMADAGWRILGKAKFRIFLGRHLIEQEERAAGRAVPNIEAAYTTRDPKSWRDG